MSPIDSPRESCISSPRRTIGVAPSSATPTSKEIRVRVEGFSKTSAMLRPASESAPSRSPRPAFSSARPVEQLAELEGAQLFAGEEVPLQAADTTARGVHRRSPGTSSTGATSRPTRSSSPGARGCCGSSERNETHVQVNRDLTAEFADAARRPAEWDVALLQECPPRFAAPLAAGLRRRGAPGAHLAQLARRPARRCWPASTPT